jgi:hypothetical protein
MKARSSLYRPLLGRNQGRGRHVDATGRGSPRPSRRLSDFERGLALLPDCVYALPWLTSRTSDFDRSACKSGLHTIAVTEAPPCAGLNGELVCRCLMEARQGALPSAVLVARERSPAARSARVRCAVSWLIATRCGFSTRRGVHSFDLAANRSVRNTRLSLCTPRAKASVGSTPAPLRSKNPLQIPRFQQLSMLARNATCNGGSCRQRACRQIGPSRRRSRTWATRGSSDEQRPPRPPRKYVVCGAREASRRPRPQLENTDGRAPPHVY